MLDGGLGRHLRGDELRGKVADLRVVLVEDFVDRDPGVGAGDDDLGAELVELVGRGAVRLQGGEAASEQEVEVFECLDGWIHDGLLCGDQMRDAVQDCTQSSTSLSEKGASRMGMGFSVARRCTRELISRRASSIAAEAFSSLCAAVSVAVSRRESASGFSCVWSVGFDGSAASEKGLRA